MRIWSASLSLLTALTLVYSAQAVRLTPETVEELRASRSSARREVVQELHTFATNRDQLIPMDDVRLVFHGENPIAHYALPDILAKVYYDGHVYESEFEGQRVYTYVAEVGEEGPVVPIFGGMKCLAFDKNLDATNFFTFWAHVDEQGQPTKQMYVATLPKGMYAGSGLPFSTTARIALGWTSQEMETFRARAREGASTSGSASASTSTTTTPTTTRK